MYALKKKNMGSIPVFMPDDLLEKQKILVCFSTRLGGQSKRRFASLNLAYHVGDDRSDVYRNRSSFLEALDLDKDLHIHACNQIHGTDIMVIEEDKKNLSPKDADGIITARKNNPIMVMGADCNLIIITDTKKKVVGAIHAGWKGTQRQILVHALGLLKEKYGSSPKDIMVFFGPSIRGCCYQVTHAFAKKFVSKFGEGDYCSRDQDGQIRMDLAKINRGQALAFGVPEQNIMDCGKCTHCDEDFFSYRRNKKTGRQAALACIVK